MAPLERVCCLLVLNLVSSTPPSHTHLRVFASRGRVRFKKALHQFLDKEGYDWVAEGGDAFCAMLQSTVAKTAKSTVTSGKGTVST